MGLLGSLVGGISAAKSLFGGKGNKAPSYETQARFAVDQQRREFAQQDKWNKRTDYWTGKSYQLAYNDAIQTGKRFQQVQTRTIQDRVRDAQKAGIHPLFALGAASANVPSGGATFIPGQYASGSGAGANLDPTAGVEGGVASWGETAANLARGWEQSRMDKEELAWTRALQSAELASKRAQATRDMAEAVLASSQAARATQASNFRQDWVKVGGKKTAPPELSGKQLPGGFTEVKRPPRALKLPGKEKHWYTGDQADAEDFEERYAEVASNLYGLASSAYDWWTYNGGAGIRHRAAQAAVDWLEGRGKKAWWKSPLPHYLGKRISYEP